MSCKHKWHEKCRVQHDSTLQKWEHNQRTKHRNTSKYDWGLKNGQGSFNLAVRLELHRRGLVDASLVYQK